jgi:hypothetical protein
MCFYGGQGGGAAQGTGAVATKAGGMARMARTKKRAKVSRENAAAASYAAMGVSD